MSQLGQTTNPADLIPGNPSSIYDVAGKLRKYANLLTEAGNGLESLDTENGWQGAAADAFQAKFKGQPSAWQEAGSCFLSAANALDAYVPVLSWAQKEASEAIVQWHAGHKQSAQSILDTARNRVSDAAGTAARTIGQARDKAPQKPGFWSDVGEFLQSALHTTENIGADALNGLASMGNAAVNNPGDVGIMLGGALLAGAGAVGDVAGTAISLTGVGAAIGVPADALSTAAIGTGVTLMAASGGDLVSHAAGRPEAMRVLVNSLQDGGGLPAKGPFEVTRAINGQNITIRGAMVKGVPKIGTAFDPSAYPGS